MTAYYQMIDRITDSHGNHDLRGVAESPADPVCVHYMGLIYLLTTDHAASSYGQPVLVNDEGAYAAGEVCCGLVSTRGPVTGRQVVERWAASRKQPLTAYEQRLVDAYLA